MYVREPLGCRSGHGPVRETEGRVKRLTTMEGASEPNGDVMNFEIDDRVRIVRLHSREREVTSAWEDAPQPRVGEVGTIVDDVGEGFYLVERTTDDGVSAWLAEFEAAELELVDRAGEE